MYIIKLTCSKIHQWLAAGSKINLLQGNDKTMYITRSSDPLLNAESTTLRGPLVASLFNHNYHKLELIVETDRVSNEQSNLRLV